MATVTFILKEPNIPTPSLIYLVFRFNNLQYRREIIVSK
jgi:hypothetical protein